MNLKKLNFINKSLAKVAIAATFVVFCLVTLACDNDLTEEPFSEFAPSNFLSTENGLNTLLNSAYGNGMVRGWPWLQTHYMNEGPTDIYLVRGGSHEVQISQYENFVNGPGHPWMTNVYRFAWPGIRDANTFLEFVGDVEFKETNKSSRTGEAKFIRVYNYFHLTGFWGEVPLVTKVGGDDLFPARTPMSEINTFIEGELLEAIDLLPVTQDQYGRITKDAARGILMQYYMRNHQWENAASIANDIMNSSAGYQLFPNYVDLFKPENEINSEYILVTPERREFAIGNAWMGFAFPSNYPKLVNQRNYSSHYSYTDEFVNSFDLNDDRRKVFLTEYTDTNGVFSTIVR